MKNIFLLYFLIIIFFLIEKSYSSTKIQAKKLSSSKIGRKGTLIYKVYNEIEFFKSFEDIERNIIFSTNFINKNNETIKYLIDCGFWKEKNSTTLYIFCNYNESIPEGLYYPQTLYFYYLNKEFYLPFGGTYEKSDVDYIDLYSVSYQKIVISDDISEENNNYNFKFNIISYNGEKVFLKVQTFLPLDCQKNEIDGLLHCSIDKNILNGQISSENDDIKFYYLNNEGILTLFYLVPKISLTIKKTEKENVYINFTKLLTNRTGYQGIVVYDTNITDIPYIYTNSFRMNFTYLSSDYTYLTCNLVKLKLSPLRMICRRISTFILTIEEIKEEIIFDELNFKYNFRIQPVKSNEKIFSLDYKYNSYIFWRNQNYFDFRNSTNYTIEIIGNYTILPFTQIEYKGVSFNENGNNLECEYYENIKKCIVTLEHFNGLQNGYHYIRHETNTDKKLISYETEPIYVTLPTLTITIQDIIVDKIGKNNTIIFKTYVEELFSIIDTKKKEIFEQNIIDKNDDTKKYKINCGFWKGEIIGNTSYIFCNVKDSIPEGNYYIQFNNTFFYFYYDILLVSDKYEFKKTNEEIIDLNSDIQILNITDNQEKYNLTFKIFSYYGEKLFLKINTNILLDCANNVTTNELLCTIDKYKLENQIQNESQELLLTYIDKKGSKGKFNLVDKIKVKINTIKKTDIFIGITHLLTPNVELGGNIAYDTNVTNLSYIYSSSFEIPFDGSDANLSCNLIKVNEYISLKMICTTDKFIDTPLSLKEIKEEIILDNINYNYNYRIQPAQIMEKFTLLNSYSNQIYYINPVFFNFTKNNSYSIEIIGDFKDDIKFEGISFNNQSSSNLVCENLGVIKRCNITKEHFDGVNTGYFYLNHENEKNQKFNSYEVTPIKAVLEIFIYIDKIKVEEIGKKGTFIFSAYCPKTIAFSFIEIEKKEIFGVKIFDQNDENKNYTINCGLWKYWDDLYIFCNGDEKLPQGNYYIKFDEIFFSHEYKLYLQSEKLNITKRDEDIIDIYSDKQIITINEERETKTILKFKTISYQEEKMFLYVNNIIKLDCSINNNELVCSFDTKEIQAQVISKYTKVKLISENKKGKIKKHYLVPFEFNYNLDKITVNVTLIQPLRNYIWQNEYLAFDSNVTDVQPLISDEFKMKFRSHSGSRQFFCKFIKGENTTLKMICNVSDYLDYPDLGYIENEIILDNIYYKYIFRLQKYYASRDILMRRNKYPKILGVSPNVLDFTQKDEYIVEIIFEENELPSNLSSVRFNQSAQNLWCDHLINVQKCYVKKNHFLENKTGYYHLIHGHYNDILEGKYISYEILPLKVIFKQNQNNDENNGGNNNNNTSLNIVLPVVIGVIAIIAIGVFIYIYITKKKKMEDKALIESLGNIEKQEMF